MTSMQPEALPVAPLDYARTTDSEWRSVVRGVLFGVLIWLGLQLLQLLIQFAYQADTQGWFALSSDFGWIIYGLMIVPLVVGLIGAVGAIRFRRHSRQLLLVSLVLGLVLTVVGLGWSVFQYLAGPSGVNPYRMMLMPLISLTRSIFPILLYWFFTRQAVREMFH